ncbi:MAG: hypothetical protein GX222_01235 [Ruminococcaceae bacterium]|nr:hypothetical protein [Oscillospiraceae bacterium]
MTKKFVSILSVILIIITIAFPVTATGNVTLTVNVTGTTTITVTQNGSGISPSGNVYTMPKSGGTITLSAIYSPGTFITINGSYTPSYNYNPADADSFIANVVVGSYDPPTIALSTSSSGGLSYNISSGSSLPNQSYVITILDTSNNEKLKLETTALSGTIPLSSSIVAGATYIAKVYAKSGVFSSANSAPSAATIAGAAPKTYKLTLKPSDGGSVTDIDGEYIEGKEIEISATASSGYKFYEWTSSNGGTLKDSSKAETTFKMPANDVTLTANFKKAYRLFIDRNEGGTVTNVDGYYYEGEKVTIRATVKEGFAFVNWTTSAGGTFGDSNSYSTTFTMPANDVNIFGTFKATDPSQEQTEESESAEEGLFFEIKTNVLEGGNIIITQNKAKEGQTITVNAKPSAGWVFEGWITSDGGSFVDDKAATTIFTMPPNETTLTAVFKKAEGEGAVDKPETPDNSGQGKKSKGFLILVGAVALGAIALIGGIIWLIVDKRRRLEDEYFEDGFDDYESDDYRHQAYDYDNDDFDSQPEKPEREPKKSRFGKRKEKDYKPKPDNIWKSGFDD